MHGHGGTVGTEEQWTWRNSRHRGIQRKHRGTVGTEQHLGTEEQWAQRNSRHRGTDEQLRTEEQSTQCVACVIH